MLSAAGKVLARPGVVAALVLAALGVVFLAGGLRLGMWTDDGPGPGLLPAISAALLLVLLALMVLGIAREPHADGFKAEPLIGTGLCCACAVLAPRIGVLVPACLLIFAWVKFLHGQSWLTAVAVSIGLTAIGLLLFRVLLKVPIPLIAGVL
jgi:putative tricarboxylic transport membrane protein